MIYVNKLVQFRVTKRTSIHLHLQIANELWTSTLKSGSKHTSLVGVEMMQDADDPTLKVVQFFIFGFLLAIGIV